MPDEHGAFIKHPPENGVFPVFTSKRMIPAMKETVFLVEVAAIGYMVAIWATIFMATVTMI